MHSRGNSSKTYDHGLSKFASTKGQEEKIKKFGALLLMDHPDNESVTSETSLNTSRRHESEADLSTYFSTSQDLEKLCHQVRLMQAEIQELKKEKSVVLTENEQLKKEMKSYEAFRNEISNLFESSSQDLTDLLATVRAKLSKSTKSSFKSENLRYNIKTMENSPKASVESPVSTKSERQENCIFNDISHRSSKASDIVNNQSLSIIHNNSQVLENIDYSMRQDDDCSTSRITHQEEDEIVEVGASSKKTEFRRTSDQAKETRVKRKDLKERFVRSVRLILQLLTEEYGFGMTKLLKLGAEREDKLKLQQAKERMDKLETLTKTYYRSLPHFKGLDEGKYASTLEELIQFFEKLSSACVQEKTNIKEINSRILTRLADVVCNQQELMIEVMKIHKL